MNPLQLKVLLTIALGRGAGLSVPKSSVLHFFDREKKMRSVLESLRWCVSEFDSRDAAGVRLRVNDESVLRALGVPERDLFADDPAVCVPRPTVCVPHTQPDAIETFKRLNVKTSNVLNVNVLESDVETIKRRIRAFVGDEDWLSRRFWNSGLGWQARLFTEEFVTLESALNFVETGLRSGELRIRKTRGATLWDEFQRQRARKI